MRVFQSAESIYTIKKTNLNTTNQNFTSNFYAKFRHQKIQKNHLIDHSRDKMLHDGGS